MMLSALADEELVSHVESAKKSTELNSELAIRLSNRIRLSEYYEQKLDMISQLTNHNNTE